MSLPTSSQAEKAETIKKGKENEPLQLSEEECGAASKSKLDEKREKKEEKRSAAIMKELLYGPLDFNAKKFLRSMKEEKQRAEAQSKKETNAGKSRKKTKKQETEDPFVDFDELQKLLEEKKRLDQPMPKPKRRNIYLEKSKLKMASPSECEAMHSTFCNLLTKPGSRKLYSEGNAPDSCGPSCVLDKFNEG